MLYADKQNLETDLKVSLLAIRERELVLYTNNCRNIGTLSCVLFGFAYSAMLFANWEHFAGISETSKSIFEFVTLTTMYLNTAAMFAATTSAMLGPGLALRGPDGAMDQAVEGLALEYRLSFLLFIGGLIAFYMVSTVFLMLDYDDTYEGYDAVLHACLLLAMFIFLRSTWKNVKRIYKKFRLPVAVAVGGSFDPDVGGAPSGPSPEALELERLSRYKTRREWPRRQYLHACVFLDDFLGISRTVFQQRFKTVRGTGGGSDSRRYNRTLHSIIRYLERPTGRAGPIVKPYSVDGAVSSTRPAGRRPSVGGGIAGWLGFGGGEASVSLTGSVPTELELAAMSPAEHLTSGAISVADSDSSNGGLAAGQ